jgi:ATP-dependent Clp protease ATP-binding subunit ClpA
MLIGMGIFNPESVGDERTIAILHAATDRATSKVRPSDFLASAIETGDAKVIATFTRALKHGSTPRDVLDTINVYNQARSTPNTDFDGKRECFSAEALEALDQFDANFKKFAEDNRDATLPLLLCCILSHTDAEDKEYLGILDTECCAKLFRGQVEDAVKPLAPLFDSASNRLRSDEFSENAWSVMEHASAHASDLGYDLILPPHCFLALVGETEGVAEDLVRLQAQPEISPGKVAEMVVEAFRLSDRRRDPVKLVRDGFGEATIELLMAAQRTAQLWGEERIDTFHLLAALLDAMPQRLASVLKRSPLNLDLEKMRLHLDQQLRDVKTQPRKEIAFRLPAGLLPSEDLTYRARTGTLSRALHFDPYFKKITKALYRRGNNHVLVTGLRGVGKTALVWELARRASEGEFPFLKRKRFLWVDCREVATSESKNKLGGILTYVASRTDLILCLDGLGSLLRAESGGNNKIILRGALKENRINLIGVLSSWDFEDLLSSDHEMLEFFTRVNVEEPKKEDAIDIVKKAAIELEQEYKLTIEERAIERAVVLSADYILNERLPTKAIKILRRVCEDIDYERTQDKGKRTSLAAHDVFKVVSEITGVPEGTLSGIGDKEVNYEEDLKREVIGQEEAVKAVATELHLIKAGLTEPGKPASVMFFAGLTGVGKTELAKTLARFYSSSKRLQTYTMGNFTESHSSSGIIGVPPGYVGHEQGGRLINDLNSDPYCVFLLDEAEKAHPDIWKPFLNLFDEGWIVDQRGVKAFADRAIFILTSNAGHEIISRMSEAGERMDKIIEAVKDSLSEVMREGSTQPVFPPEFLARIRQIIIFKPLDEKSMKGICDKLADRMISDWKEKREKEIVIPQNLRKYIAKQSHYEDKNSGFKEGGRIVRKMLRDLIEAPIQREASLHEREYKECNIIELVFLPSAPQVQVRFGIKKLLSPAQCTAQITSMLKQDLLLKKGDINQAHQMIADSAARLHSTIEQWAVEHAGERGGVPDGFLNHLQKASDELEKIASNSEKESRAIVEEMIAILERGTE